MIDENTAGKRSKIAAYLLKIKAVQLSINSPFTWSSGRLSPIYCDNRLTLSYPEVRSAICESFCQEIKDRFPETEGIAGVATGGIAHAALVADTMALPMVYIRGKAKGHGLKNLVEGRVDSGKPYLVIEDLISTGKSSLAAVKALEETGAKVIHTLSIFNYGLPSAIESFEGAGQSFSSLTNLSALLAVAKDQGLLSESERLLIEKWQKNPEKWQIS